MTGGKARPRKDRAIKVSNAETVKTGQILVRGFSTYKPGMNVNGINTLFATCPGKIYFTRKKTPHGKVRTFINIMPVDRKDTKQ